MSLNDEQKDNLKALAKVPPAELCDCGWYRVDECKCDDARKYSHARDGRNRSLTRLREALAEIERLSAEVTAFRGLCFAIGSETTIPYEEIERRLKSVSGTQNFSTRSGAPDVELSEPESAEGDATARTSARDEAATVEAMHCQTAPDGPWNPEKYRLHKTDGDSVFDISDEYTPIGDYSADGRRCVNCSGSLGYQHFYQRVNGVDYLFCCLSCYDEFTADSRQEK